MRVTGEPFTAVVMADGEELWRGRVDYVHRYEGGQEYTEFDPVTEPPEEPFRKGTGRHYIIDNEHYDELLLTVMRDEPS